MLSDKIFEVHLCLRKRFLKFLETYTPEQLAKIPEGFHNNVFWNIAHCVATEQILFYKFSDTPTLVSEEFIDKYKKGTAPTGEVPTLSEIEELKHLLSFTAKQLEENYKKGVFQHYNPYTTSLGYPMDTIEDVFYFNNTHEGMHLGTILALNYFL
ncbi:MAG: DinB family protein [Capnocytophaga sp.]|nr:DinB family protein [Capnocytophaga sp.]